MSHFKKNFNKWKTDTGEHGPRALTRYVIMLFVEGLQGVAPDKYIFKGGNLLWHYIKTPRSTVDVDFATETDVEVGEVISDFKKVSVEDCVFKVLDYKVIASDDKSGASVQMEFLTSDGSTNPFSIDVVFAVQTHSKQIKLARSEVKAASLENIIVDKVAACWRFGGGNTRMKDFDDLYRIAKTQTLIDSKVLVGLASDRQVKLTLERKWISPPMEGAWRDYTRKKVYKGAADLPSDLLQVFEYINKYLYNVTNIAK